MLSANSFSQRNDRCSGNALSSPYGTNQLQSNYAGDMVTDDNLEGLSYCQISNELATSDANSKNANADGVQNNFLDNHDVWLPQPIYPLGVENKSECKSSSITRMENISKKKNVQNWLQKITPLKTSTPKIRGNNNKNPRRFEEKAHVADFYGGGFVEDVRL